MPRAMILLFILPLAFPTAPEALAQRSDGCPPGSDRARKVVESYLSAPNWVEERDRVGITVSPSKVRLLTDAQDPDVCQTLADRTTDRNGEAVQHHFYKAGPYYFDVALLQPPNEWPDGDVPNGRSGLVIYDEEFELAGIYML